MYDQRLVVSGMTWNFGAGRGTRRSRRYKEDTPRRALYMEIGSKKKEHSGGGTKKSGTLRPEDMQNERK